MNLNHSKIADCPVSPFDARKRLESAANLHWVHWTVVLGSLVLAVLAWQYSCSQRDARIELNFEREAEHVIELIHERMRKYEDALWSGIGLIQAHENEIDFDRWNSYTDTIRIHKKYPGIRALGVADAVREDQVDAYHARQRVRRPGYTMHPQHPGKLKLPIYFLSPGSGEEQLFGLDIAHEQNRSDAAEKALASGECQMTGPIELVIGKDKTPSFLLLAPYYQDQCPETVEQRKEAFSGLVFGKFVVRSLMKGTLEKQKRHVGLRLTDNGTTLYDELNPSDSDFDPDPLFKRQATVGMFGRTWKFDIASAKSFREATQDPQPLTILVGGIGIDLMLMFLFVSISRSSKQALHLADQMTEQLEISSKSLSAKAQELQQSNEDLEQYAYVASHDLQEPLRKVASFCQLLKDEFGDRLGDTGNSYADFAIDGANRMRGLVQGLLKYSTAGMERSSNAEVDSNDVFELVLSNLSTSIAESKATVTASELPKVAATEQELTQLFQNLIGNSLNYRSEKPPEVKVSAVKEGDEWTFSVADNGIGIDPKYHDRVFGIFKRLNTRNKHSGSGIGLAICKRIVDGLNGVIWIDPTCTSGCTVCFTIPVVSRTRKDSVAIDPAQIPKPMPHAFNVMPNPFSRGAATQEANA